MEWIKCTEGLPKDGVGVLITDGQYIVTAQRYEDYWSSHGFGGYEWEWDIDIDKVTHWASLPELPKK